MKKIMMTLAAVCVAATMNAQVWVGGSLGFSTNHTNGNQVSLLLLSSVTSWTTSWVLVSFLAIRATRLSTRVLSITSLILLM